jgi:NitT/TauT family transport system substrate-binding protein
VLFVLAVLAGASIWRRYTPAKNPAGLEKVTICQYGDLLIYLPLYIAADQKFFEREGIQINFINGGGDDKTFAAVSSGSAQFGVSDPTFTAIAREKGRPGVVIGSIVAGAPYYGVTWNRKVEKVKTAAELNGLRIATYEAPSTNYALMARSLKKSDDTKIVQGAYGTLLAMLKAGQADVAMELEPGASTAVRDGATIVFSYPEAFGAFMLTGIYVLEEYRDKNPRQVQKVINALERAMRFAHARPAEAVEVARRKFPEIDPEVIRIAVERMIADRALPEHVTIDRSGWKNTVQLRFEIGDLKDQGEADKAIDESFAQAAQDLTD